jgi:hypothetical protein
MLLASISTERPLGECGGQGEMLCIEQRNRVLDEYLVAKGKGGVAEHG